MAMSAMMEDNDHGSYASADEDDEEDYEYDYSDEDDDGHHLGDSDSDEDMMDGGGVGSKGTSSAARGTGAGRSRGGGGVSENPNAAPMKGVTRTDTSCSMGSDISGVGGGAAPDSIRMLESSDLLPVMKRRLREVTEVLSIPESAATVLMREHGWAKERLFEEFYSDPERVQEKCGVKARCSASAAGGDGAAPQQPSSSSEGRSGGGGRMTRSKAAHQASAAAAAANARECGICCDDDIEPSQMMGMPCGHEFCRDCWNGFVGCALSDGPACVRTTCPTVGCLEAVTEEEVAAVAPEHLDKFRMYQLRNFVEINGMTRWCPGPGCTRVAMASSAGFSGNAECDCGTIFCLRCGEEPHAPSTCSELRLWKEKCKNESETANWILANTKSCPKCSSRIEKNQGCNHMVCQQCKYEFCWICLSSWSEHGANTGGYYKCNKYDPSSGDDQSDAAKAKRELDRYLHYYKRYHAHSVAQKFAEKQLKETEARMVLLQESTDNSTWSDVEFLKTATEQLVECRRVLKYTYTFAYYLSDSTKKKERFEHHQEMLEKFTENLSELSEMPIAEMDRTDIVNQTRVVNRFMKNILTYVEDGMEED